MLILILFYLLLICLILTPFYIVNIMDKNQEYLRLLFVIDKFP